MREWSCCRSSKIQIVRHRICRKKDLFINEGILIDNTSIDSKYFKFKRSRCHPSFQFYRPRVAGPSWFYRDLPNLETASFAQWAWRFLLFWGLSLLLGRFLVWLESYNTELPFVGRSFLVELVFGFSRANSSLLVSCPNWLIYHSVPPELKISRFQLEL